MLTGKNLLASMARTLNNFKTDDLGMSFKRTVMGSFIHLVCVYAGCDQFF